MEDSYRRKVKSSQHRRRSWCCSFAIPPSSPENLKTRSSKPGSINKSRPKSVPGSPQSSKSGLNLVNRIDPRRILSPGRVSPIDSDPTAELGREIGQTQFPVADLAVPRSRSASFRAPLESSFSNLSGQDPGSGSGDGDLYDVRLNLKGKNGGCLVLEMNSAVLSANSAVFAGLIEEFNNNNNNNVKRSGGFLEKRNVCRIEVPEVENLGVFRQTIELMFEENITSKLMKIGAYRSIDVLEVSILCSSFNAV